MTIKSMAQEQHWWMHSLCKVWIAAQFISSASFFEIEIEISALLNL